MQDRKNKLIRLITILGILLLVLVLISIIITSDKKPEDVLAYINSDEMKDGVTSPDMIHIVLGLYKGELNPKALSKSTYIFISEIIPEYSSKLKNEKQVEKYFDKNTERIKLELGITGKKDFKELVEKVQKLKGNLNLEYATFDKDSVKVNRNNTQADLKIKYYENPELTFNITIHNKVKGNSSTIVYK